MSMPTTDTWASSDHDPLSPVEPILATTCRVQAISGTLIAQYPDFPPGAAVRVLPVIVSNRCPTDCRVVDDSWTFAGPTRHPEYATIRHIRDRVSVAIDRHRLRPLP